MEDDGPLKPSEEIVEYDSLGRVKSPGRPRIMPTLERTEKILAFIRAGVYAHVAAIATGISYATFHRWMNRDEPEFIEFRDKVNEARAQARAAVEVQVRKTKPEIWLTRGPGRELRGQDNFGGPGWTSAERMELTGEGGGPVQLVAGPKLDYSKLTLEELKELERLERKALASGEPAGGDRSGDL